MAPAKKKNARYKTKQLDYNSLNLSDVLCPICRTIVVEPVSLPCQHLFCYTCFNCTIENNSLSCPICRLRIGSWLRNSSKTNTVINSELWEWVKSNFKNELEAKASGNELTFSNTNEPVKLKLSEPGEIRQEYEKQLTVQQQIYRSEREKEAKLSQELIKKLQEEEKRLRLENEKRLQRDAELAKKLANSLSQTSQTVIDKYEPSSSVKSNKTTSDIIFNRNNTSRNLNIINNKSSSLLYRVRSRAILAEDTSKSDILYRYDYNVKTVQNNTLGKDSSVQVNMSNNINNTSQNKKPATLSKYGCLIKSYAKKSHDVSQIKSPKADSSFGKKGSARAQQLHAMSLLRQLGQTFCENDDKKQQDSITQELCHFRPIKTAAIVTSTNNHRKRVVNGRLLRNPPHPLVYSPPKKPIARNSKQNTANNNSKTLLHIEGAKILKYSGTNSAFAAFPTIYLCSANLIISSGDNVNDSSTNDTSTTSDKCLNKISDIKGTTKSCKKISPKKNNNTLNNTIEKMKKTPNSKLNINNDVDMKNRSADDSINESVDFKLTKSGKTPNSLLKLNNGDAIQKTYMRNCRKRLFENNGIKESSKSPKKSRITDNSPCIKNMKNSTNIGSDQNCVYTDIESKSFKKSKLNNTSNIDADINIADIKNKSTNNKQKSNSLNLTSKTHLQNGDISVIVDSPSNCLENFEKFELLTEEQRERLVQEKRDLELARRLQEYLDKFDNEDENETNELSKKKLLSNSFVDSNRRGTRTSPRKKKRQMTLDAIFLSARK